MYVYVWVSREGVGCGCGVGVGVVMVVGRRLWPTYTSLSLLVQWTRVNLI